MITVYPMLVSSAVSETALPGISKMVENYLISYSMDGILADITRQTRVNYKIKRNKIIASEAEDLSEQGPGGSTRGTKTGVYDMTPEEEYDYWRDNPDQARLNRSHLAQQAYADYLRIQKGEEFLDKRAKEREEARKERQRKLMSQAGATARGIEKGTKTTVERIKQRREAARQKAAEARRTARVGKVEGMTAIDLKPTMVPVTMPDGSSAYIGVKAVPVRVKSDSKLSYLIISDLKMKWVTSLFAGVGRRVMRWVYSKVGKYDTPTGDPRKDMLMARTGTRGDAFVILDKHEDLDVDLMSSPKLLTKLFKLSWGNLIIADDNTKQASFCMKKFKGMCSTINYSMMYQTLGQKMVYDDLEDARKRSGTLFKIGRKRITKVIGEHMAGVKELDYFLREDQTMKKVGNYIDMLYLSEEADLIQEGFGDILKKLTFDKGKRLVSLVKGGDLRKVKSFGDSLGLNRLKPKKVDSFASTKINNFSDSKNLAKRVLKNSVPGLSKKVLDACSSAIAAASAIPERKGMVVKSPQKRTKDLVKKIVVRSRKWQDDYMEKQAADKVDKKQRIPEESIPDYFVGITTVITMTAIVGGGAWIVWNYIIPWAVILFWTVFLGGILAALAWGAGTILGGINK